MHIGTMIKAGEDLKKLKRKKTTMKKYIINSMPVMSRNTIVYAKDEDDAWDIFYGDKKGKIEQSDIGDLKYTDFDDYVDPEITESEGE